MKSRKTTHKERIEIVKWVINNNMNYKEAANLNGIKYALVYQWVQKYISNGPDALRLKKIWPHKKHSIAEESLSEIEKLKLELERERQLRKRVELRLEIHKKIGIAKSSYYKYNKRIKPNKEKQDELLCSLIREYHATYDGWYFRVS